MNVIETSLKDALIIEPSVFDDERGYFYEGYSAEKFTEMTGQDFHVKQMNFSKSSKGVLRGLHFQKEPMAQAKLVSVNVGEVWDVAVDIRLDSPTFGHWHGEILSAENKRRFFIPRGFAHGFVALTEGVELMYAVDNLYAKEHDAGIIYNDSVIGIDWKIEPGEIILSKKDHYLLPLNSL